MGLEIDAECRVTEGGQDGEWIMNGMGLIFGALEAVPGYGSMFGIIGGIMGKWFCKILT